MNNKKLAVFFDCENISATYVKETFDELANYGEVIIRKAYADWSNKNNKAWNDKFHKFTIEPMHIIPNVLNKNASDIKMVIDVMNTMISSKIDVIALVSSDSDFTSLVIDIKSKGFEVIGFGEKKTPESLRNAYSTFIELPIKNKTADSNDEGLIEILKDAINSTKEENDYTLISTVGTYLKNKNSSFIAKNYGANTWGDIFKKYSNIFEISYLDDRKSKIVVKIKNDR
ncbi:conserved hypothetical protein [Sulfurovum sp. enrichment culture clone C5]|uniref:HTH OST-type domain-containing protein n=1 Tax=Sulfurovum sp. enrichment culture clone C5 TaxID=497650 RepID=A0A0S4XMS0_9BACT|nr:conserved hypothetical protein [Sulfurovum sp. enrichment culture clone C5]